MRGRAAMVTATAAVLAALALPGAAGAGGFATVGLSSLPDGTAPGKPWHVTLTILQHGRTPLPGLSPEVRIRSADGRKARTFAARPARRPGLYTADVVFPTAGQWRYAIADGFSQTHTFAPAAIGTADRTASVARPAPGPEDGGGPNLGAAIAAAAVAGLLAALLADALMRRRRPGPAPAAAR